jgi:hypothetical protein
MHSRQINFYAVPDDLIVWEDYFKQNEIVFIRLPFYQKDDFLITENICDYVREKEFDKILLTKKGFLENIHAHFVEKQKYFLIEEMYSEVVEFSRPLKNRFYGYYERSRFYFIKSYFDKQDQRVYKSEAFLNWADQLFKDFKKRFLVAVKEDKGDYYTRTCLDMIDKNIIQKKPPLNNNFRIEE